MVSTGGCGKGFLAEMCQSWCIREEGWGLGRQSLSNEQDENTLHKWVWEGVCVWWRWRFAVGHAVHVQAYLHHTWQLRSHTSLSHLPCQVPRPAAGRRTGERVQYDALRVPPGGTVAGGGGDSLAAVRGGAVRPEGGSPHVSVGTIVGYGGRGETAWQQYELPRPRPYPSNTFCLPLLSLSQGQEPGVGEGCFWLRCGAGGSGGRGDPAGHVWRAVLRVRQCWQVRGARGGQGKGGRARGDQTC